VGNFEGKIMGKLVDRQLRSLPEGKRHGDGDGLYFVRRGGSMSWFLRWMKDGKAHEASLGQYDQVSLAEARQKAREAHRLIAKGIDPIEAKKDLRSSKLHTFKAAAEDCIQAKKAAWGNEKHADQWTSTLSEYAYPIIGEKPVAEITTDHILKILKPIWATKTETACRVRGRIEAVLNYAKTRGWRSGENPASWRGHLENALPARSKVAAVNHHAAVPWANLPPVVAKLSASGAMSAYCLLFIIYTGVRSGEARGARWDEINLAERVWTVAADRMKGERTRKRSHRVPLSDAAVDVLKAVQPVAAADDSLVFPGGRAGVQLSDVAVSKALGRAFKGATVHGMRSSFRDWCAESTIYPREVAEAALAHTNKDKTEAAYFRSDLLEARRPLMRDWADFVTSHRPEEADLPILADEPAPGKADAGKLEIAA